MQREQIQVAGLVKQFGSPAVRLRGGPGLAQHGADVNRLAVIAAVIYAQLLHAENFTQSREDARKFLTKVERGFFKPRMKHGTGHAAFKPFRAGKNRFLQPRSWSVRTISLSVRR
jgi:hypothetical protein